MNRQILLRSRPKGLPVPENFELVRTPVPEIEAGQFLLKTEFLGLAPAARLRMGESESYAAPTPLGAVVYGQAAGTVIASKNEAFCVGVKAVIMDGGWQDYVVSDGTMATKVDEAKAPLTLWLGALGTSGLTAYTGLLAHGKPVAGETVVVSAATGAVGSAVGQIARIRGCRVVGIAGGGAKAAYAARELGFDACVDYKAGDLAGNLGAACPDGIDVYFDNAGGPVRDAVYARMNVFGRIVLCGMISEYNDDTPRAGPNWFPILSKRLTIRGFLTRDHMDLKPRFTEEMSSWVREGKIVVREDVTVGLEQTPLAFIRMLLGDNFGKTIVQVATSPGDQ